MNAKEIIKKFLEKFRKPKHNFLEGNVDKNFDKAKYYRQQHRLKKQPIVEVEQEESLEECIEEFIYRYRQQIQNGEDNDVSYKAFTRMFYGEREDVEDNEKFQQKLKDKIHKSKKYRIDGQYTSKGKPIFYHISKTTPESERITDKNENMNKIYLNCERKDIARLTGEILKKIDKIDKCAFKMKFLAESDEMEKSKRYQRNDKIVIYTDNEIDKERIISSIIELKRSKPELFSSKKRIPLMPKINGFIGCVKQGKNTINTPLYDYVPADTYNSKLAKMMEHCMISSIIDVFSRDEKIYDYMNGYYGDDPIECLKAFGMMDQSQIKQVVGLFKEQFIKYCEKSNIEICGEKKETSQQR